MRQLIGTGVLFAFLAVVLAGGGCGTVVTAGHVTGKREVPAHLAVEGDIVRWVPREYQLHVEAANGAIVWQTVPLTTYRRIHRGDFWSLP